MFSHLVRTLIVVAVGSSFLVGAVSCMQPAARKSKKGADSGDYFEEDDYVYEEEDVPEETVTITTDAGVISVPTRPSDGGGDARNPTVADGGACTTPINAGDLRVVEIMINSRTGSGDLGEWVEVQNYRPCTVNVKGVTVSSPRGSSGSVDSATVTTDLFIAPFRTFVVANDVDPAKNGGLPQPVIAWQQTDVLKNDGDTIEVKTDTGLVVDTFVYPYVTSDPGKSLAFPYDCAWDKRDQIGSYWSRSVYAYGNALYGTPNNDNWDVGCAPQQVSN